MQKTDTQTDRTASNLVKRTLKNIHSASAKGKLYANYVADESQLQQFCFLEMGSGSGTTEKAGQARPAANAVCFRLVSSFVQMKLQRQLSQLYLCLHLYTNTTTCAKCHFRVFAIASVCSVHIDNNNGVDQPDLWPLKLNALLYFLKSRDLRPGF